MDIEDSSRVLPQAFRSLAGRDLTRRPIEFRHSTYKEAMALCLSNLHSDFRFSEYVS